MSSIAQEVRQFIVENFLFGREQKLSDEDSFLERGIIDSTGVLELVSFLETRYGLKVEDDELLPENLDSVRSVTAFVAGKLQGGSQFLASRIVSGTERSSVAG
jgi:acyl carrier protein